MKLDVNVLRYLSKEDFRVLTAVEMGQKNHEIVPVQLIDSISGLKHGGAYRCLKTLLQHKLVHHESAKYDGYRLTYMGYDFLAIKTLTQRGHICGVGRQIGVGKESDIFEVTNEEGEVFALKLHRLGRTSFRDVKSKRDYLGRGKHYSWLYLSRLAALKEYAFMKALGDHGFPVPEAIDQNRHAVLMALVDAQPLVQLRQLDHPGRVYASAMDLIYRLAAKGLVHCDFNEFNLMVDEAERLTVIDFPQMVSVSHLNAQELFDRDVECIVRFFTKKIGYMPQHDPDLPYLRPSFEAAVAEAAAAGASGLDVELAASGFQKQHAEALERFLQEGSEEAEGSGGEEDGEGSSGYGSGSEDTQEELGEVVRHSSSGSRQGNTHGASGSGSEGEEAQQEDAGVSSSSRQVGEAAVGPSSAAAAQGAAAAAAAAAVGQQLAGVQLTQRQQQQQEGALQHGSGVEADAQVGCSSSGGEDSGSEEGEEDVWADVPSSSRGAATVDLSHKGREVQQRLVAQRQRASTKAGFAKAGRNVTKARGKKAQQTAAALREW